MNRKGQAALEFLSTYGFAFLIILVMIGALAYFGVLNPQRFVPDRCTFAGNAFGCEEYQASGQELTMVLRNNQGFALDYNAASGTDPATAGSASSVDYGAASGCTAGADQGTLGANFTAVAGDTFVVRCTWPAATLVADTKLRATVDVNYQRNGGSLSQVSQGDVLTTVQ